MGYVKIEMDQYPQAILWHIWETSKNAEFLFTKFTPLHSKNRFSEPKGPPLDLKKYFFQIGPNYCICIAFGLTIPKFYNTWVLKIFLVNIFFKNILSLHMSKYYFQTPKKFCLGGHFGRFKYFLNFVMIL